MELFKIVPAYIRGYLFIFKTTEIYVKLYKNHWKIDIW